MTLMTGANYFAINFYVIDWRALLSVWLLRFDCALYFVFDYGVSDSSTLFYVIVELMTRSPCYVLGWCFSDFRTLFCVWLLRFWIACFPLCLVDTSVTLARCVLCFVFDCCVRDSCAVWVLLSRLWPKRFSLCLFDRITDSTISFMFDCFFGD